MKTNDKGVALIKKWEGLRTKAYKDGGGVLTIGYGHTSAAGGLKVTSGLVITEAQAEALLKEDLGKFEARVNSLVKVPLTGNQHAALVSFDFNTGALHKSILLKVLNQGNYKAVPAELRKWVNDNGKKIQGLVNRREDEIKLWNASQTVTQPRTEVPVSVPPDTSPWWLKLLRRLLRG